MIRDMKKLDFLISNFRETGTFNNTSNYSEISDLCSLIVKVRLLFNI